MLGLELPLSLLIRADDRGIGPAIAVFVATPQSRFGIARLRHSKSADGVPLSGEEWSCIGHPKDRFCPEAAVNRAEISQRSKPLTDPGQCGMLPQRPWLGQSDAV